MLYKYRCDDENSLALIEKQEIWLPFPRDFNDPFDSKMVIIAEGTKQEIKKWSERLDFSKIAQKMAYESMRIPEKREEIIKKTEEENQKFIIVYCLTPHCDNQLMWSHYSNSHKGICIGFETEIINGTECLKFNDIDVYKSPSYQDMYIPIMPVTYKDEMPNPYNLFTSTKDDVAPFLLNKPKFWEYEHERRIIVVFPLYQKHKFIVDKSSIKKIILGCRCSTSYENKIKEIIRREYYDKGLYIDLLRAGCSRNSYTLNFQSISL